MMPPRGPASQPILLVLWLFGLLSAGHAAAQPLQPSAPPSPPPPAAQPLPPPPTPADLAPVTLRLTQVVPRLPAINLYAIAQTQNGLPADLRSSEFSALVGPNNVPASVTRDNLGIAIVFLVDISASLTAQQFSLIKADVLAWIDSLGPNDRAAIVTLGSSVRTVQDFTRDKSALSEAMRPLAPRDQQTLLYQGLVQALDLSRRLDADLPLRRAIVTLTDGLDDQKGGAGRQEVLDRLALDPTPIYGIGASAVKDSKVDAALKDFAGLVRASGGEFRAVNLQNLNQTYNELRQLVRSTAHLTVSCPACVPDGTAAVIRLIMTDGRQRLQSEAVTARMVNADGRVQPAAAPPPPPEPPEKPAASPPPPEARQTAWTFNVAFKFLLNAPLPWLAVLTLIVGGIIALAFQMLRRQISNDDLPTTPPVEPSARIESGNVEISARVAVRPGTQQDKRRLRLYPLGHNDLEPIEAVFEDRLTLGRSEDRDICIPNDGQVSASHCSLSPQGPRILVQDEGSRNGTRLNGVPFSGFVHAEDDTILGVGRTEMRIRVLEPGER